MKYSIENLKLPKDWTWKALESEIDGKQTNNLKRRIKSNIQTIENVLNVFDYEIAIIPKSCQLAELHEKGLTIQIKEFDGKLRYCLYEADGSFVTMEEYREGKEPFQDCSFSVNDKGQVTAVFM